MYVIYCLDEYYQGFCYTYRGDTFPCTDDLSKAKKYTTLRRAEMVRRMLLKKCVEFKGGKETVSILCKETMKEVGSD